MICRLFRSTNVGVLVSGPIELMPDTEMFAKRVPGTKNSFGSNAIFSMLSVASKARFHATFATFNAFDASSQDRKSTRLNCSHDQISYAVFCLKKKLLPTDRYITV